MRSTVESTRQRAANARSPSRRRRLVNNSPTSQHPFQCGGNTLTNSVSNVHYNFPNDNGRLFDDADDRDCDARTTSDADVVRGAAAFDERRTRNDSTDADTGPVDDDNPIRARSQRKHRSHCSDRCNYA